MQFFSLWSSCIFVQTNFWCRQMLRKIASQNQHTFCIINWEYFDVLNHHVYDDYFKVLVCMWSMSSNSKRQCWHSLKLTIYNHWLLTIAVNIIRFLWMIVNSSNSWVEYSTVYKIEPTCYKLCWYHWTKSFYFYYIMISNQFENDKLIETNWDLLKLVSIFAVPIACLVNQTFRSNTFFFTHG